jgi:cytochrome o ubiquinol oxidase subunit IV
MMRRYFIGFAISLILTLLAALVVILGIGGTGAKIMLVALALIQCGVQMAYFLHLGREKGQEFEVAFFAFTLIVVGILVGGTLWIMGHLAHHTGDLERFKDGVIAPQNQLD